MTKPFVAAGALRLVELGALRLDASLDSLLPATYVEVLRAGGYDTAAITLRHLLTHTSGIYDFAAIGLRPVDHRRIRPRDRTADPSHRWTRLEQVRFAVDHGKPYGAPGERLRLLRHERVPRRRAARAGDGARHGGGDRRAGGIRSARSAPDLPGVDRSRALRRAAVVTPVRARHRHRDVRSASIDLWGGGGLVSTCRDLARFFRALLRDEIYDRPETLVTMTTRLDDVPRAAEMTGEDDPRDRAMYLFRAEIAGEDWWGHGGWWGTPRTPVRASTSRSWRRTSGVHARGLRPHGRDRRSSARRSASPPGPG